MWNVSRSTPLDSFKLKKTGFHALHVLNSPLAKKGKAELKKAHFLIFVGFMQLGFHCSNVTSLRPINTFSGSFGLSKNFLPTAQSSCSPSKSQHTSSTSEAVPPPTLSQNQSFSLPPGQAVCCFMDGGVGLYDMGAKKWDFLRDLVLSCEACCSCYLATQAK